MAGTLEYTSYSSEERTKRNQKFYKKEDFVNAIVNQYEIKKANGNKSVESSVLPRVDASTVYAELTFKKNRKRHIIPISSNVILDDNIAGSKERLLASILMVQAESRAKQKLLHFKKAEDRQRVRQTLELFDGLYNSFEREVENPNVVDIDSLLASDERLLSEKKAKGKALTQQIVPTIILGGTIAVTLATIRLPKPDKVHLISSGINVALNQNKPYEIYNANNSSGYIIPNIESTRTPTPEPVIYVDPDIIEFGFVTDTKDITKLPRVGWNRLADFGDLDLQYYLDAIKNKTIPDVLYGQKPAVPHAATGAGGRFWATLHDSGLAPAITFYSKPATDVPGFYLTEYKEKNYIIFPNFVLFL